MPVASEKGGGDFTPAPVGTHLARCIGVVSLGTQKPSSPTFNPQFKIMLTFELPNELLPDTKEPMAMTVNKEFSCSLSKKANLRGALESWRGRVFTQEELDGFDVVKVLGAPCMLGVIHKTSSKGGTYADVSSISALPKGMQAVPQTNPSVHYEIEMGRNDVFQKLPEWIRKKIEQCEEWTSKSPSSPAGKAQAEQQQATPTSLEEEADNCPF